MAPYIPKKSFTHKCVCVIQSIGVILLIIVSTIGVIALLIVALAVIITVVLPLCIPLAFVWHVVPRLCDYYQQLVEDRANSTITFKQFPPDILQEVFLFCCGEEDVDFFYHFSLYQPGPDRREGDGSHAVDYQGRERRPEYNMAYILKGVCKDWKLLVERTPALWQKIFLGDVLGSTHTSFRSLEHCKDMMQHVLLPRCAGLPIEIKIRQVSASQRNRKSGQFERLFNAHMEYIDSIVRLLAEHGSRWSALAFENWRDSADMNPNTHLERLLQTLSSSKFDNLHSLSIRPSTCPPRFNLSKSAPHLHKLVLLQEWRPNLRQFQGSLVLQWSSVTTLVMNLHVAEFDAEIRVEVIARVLSAVRHNIKHLVWLGIWDESYPISAQTLSRIFDGPHLELRNLRSLVLGGSRASFHFSTTFLPYFLCDLEKLHLLWCTESPGRRDRGTGEWILQRPNLPIEAVAQLLHRSPTLQEVAILFTSTVFRFRENLKANQPSFASRGYLIFRGSRNRLRTQVAERLDKDAGMSSRLLLADLTQHSPHLVKRMLSRILPLVPWYTYSLQLEESESHIYLIPPSTPTPFEQYYPDYKDDHERDWSDTLERAFSFIDEISRSAQLGGTHNARVANVRTWNILDTNRYSLHILAEIIDMIRDHSAHGLSDSPSPYVRELDTTDSTCIFTLAVAL